MQDVWARVGDREVNLIEEMDGILCRFCGCHRNLLSDISKSS